MRALRVNFSQVGNYEAVNEAASIEVQLTGIHLYNAAYSRQAYYRNRYVGFERLKNGLLHLKWKLLDLLWGNGESVFRVFTSAAFMVVMASFWLYMRSVEELSYETALKISVLRFCGDGEFSDSDWPVTLLLVVSQLVLSGFFMAILIKRMSRR